MAIRPHGIPKRALSVFRACTHRSVPSSPGARGARLRRLLHHPRQAVRVPTRPSLFIQLLDSLSRVRVHTEAGWTANGAKAALP
eukprot:CAMPEP_0181408714 /NCGR_PEP_ID=MMETSP1110-20121109/6444_1 /TAXON_ID=174948 /ORGANISM="Symbiodinium sp., Strain CCMP421" /LENGTH=83 /DNA_ID=CAMNT_0023531195 /DNA_START=570 /DNA_END=817 /DNA_ORIENTATION=-